MSDPTGPSKYDDVARFLCGSMHAECVVVVILGGPRGDGAAQAETPLADPYDAAARRALLARGLRAMADDVEHRRTPPVGGRRW